MKFRATMDRSRETDEKCLVPSGNLIERSRTINSDGKMGKNQNRTTKFSSRLLDASLKVAVVRTWGSSVFD